MTLSQQVDLTQVQPVAPPGVCPKNVPSDVLNHATVVRPTGQL